MPAVCACCMATRKAGTGGVANSLPVFSHCSQWPALPLYATTSLIPLTRIEGRERKRNKNRESPPCERLLCVLYSVVLSSGTTGLHVCACVGVVTSSLLRTPPLQYDNAINLKYFLSVSIPQLPLFLFLLLLPYYVLVFTTSAQVFEQTTNRCGAMVD